MKKILKRILTVVACLMVLLIGGVCFVFKDEIKTINSIEKVDDYGMFQMTSYNDYGLDKLIAQGGANNDGEIVEFVVKQVLKGLPIEFNIPDFGCSTFQVENNAGEWLFARNYDLSYVPSMIVKTNPENGYASVAVANISIMGYNEENLPTNFANSVMALASPYTVMDGMNEKGLSMGVLLIKDTPTNQTGKEISMTTTSAIRYILEKAKDVDEAIKLLENMNMKASAGADYHFQLADATGNSAIIEYIDNEISVIRKGEKPMQLTNFIVSDANYNFGKGQDRYEIILDAREKANGVMESDEAMQVLKAVSQSSYDPVTDEGSSTQWSVVYNNSTLTMDICAGGQFDKVHSFSPFE